MGWNFDEDCGQARHTLESFKITQTPKKCTKTLQLQNDTKNFNFDLKKISDF